MWINISCFILAAIILLFIETRYTLYKLNKLGNNILLAYPPNYSDDSLNISFNHYFLANTGIFVGTAYCFEKIMIFSALHSISMFICIIFALLNAFYSLWSLSAAFSVVAILLIFACNLSTEFPLRNNVHKTFLRTILNFKNKYPNNDICKKLDIAQASTIGSTTERLFSTIFLGEKEHLGDFGFFGRALTIVEKHFKPKGMDIDKHIETSHIIDSSLTSRAKTSSINSDPKQTDTI